MSDKTLVEVFGHEPLSEPKVVCRYCKEPAVRTHGADVYPHKRPSIDRWFWHCAPCEAWVPCLRDEMTPAGSLADAPLRLARKEAASAIYMLKGMGSKKEVRKWLAFTLAIPVERCYVDKFGTRNCRRTIEAVALVVKIHRDC